jgi:hypothetical protein
MEKKKVRWGPAAREKATRRKKKVEATPDHDQKKRRGATRTCDHIRNREFSGFYKRKLPKDWQQNSNGSKGKRGSCRHSADAGKEGAHCPTALNGTLINKGHPTVI